MKRLKVLVSAYACSPDQGSEPGMGWGWVKSLSESQETCVITNKKYEKVIQKWCENHQNALQNVRFYYVARRKCVLLEKIWPPSYYWTYKSWQKEAYKLAKKLCGEIDFDVVHQLNMIGYREPGYLWKLDKPFVWGPVGGTADVNLRFASVLGVRETLYHLCRNVINSIQLRFSRRVKKVVKRADCFVTATSDTQRAFLKTHGRKGKLISEVGFDAKGFVAKSASVGERKIKLVWSGLFLSRKALPIALEAVAKLPKDAWGGWELDIVGDGPMRNSWRKLSKRLGVDGNCRWYGWVERERALEILGEADAMLMTSLQEATSTVVMEALAKGTPVICFDHCGMADVVNEHCGIKIPVTTPGRAAEDFANAIRWLAEDREELWRSSLGARQRADQFSWESLALRMNSIYQEAIANYRGGKKEREEDIAPIEECIDELV